MERTSVARHVVVIGAGPAGLTAAAELAQCRHQVTILEKDPKYVGGIGSSIQNWELVH